MRVRSPFSVFSTATDKPLSVSKPCLFHLSKGERVNHFLIESEGLAALQHSKQCDIWNAFPTKVLYNKEHTSLNSSRQAAAHAYQHCLVTFHQEMNVHPSGEGPRATKLCSNGMPWGGVGACTLAGSGASASFTEKYVSMWPSWACYGDEKLLIILSLRHIPDGIHSALLQKLEYNDA